MELQCRGESHKATQSPTQAQGADEVNVESPSQTVECKDPSSKSYQIKDPKFAILFSCVLMMNFLIGYVSSKSRRDSESTELTRHWQDTSCIATLTPVITDQFHALHDLGWYTVA